MADRLSSIPSPNSLSGTVIRSEVQPEVTYRLERQIGEGGMGTAFLALRQGPDGVSPVVIKMVRAGFGTGPADAAAGMVVLKEAVALGLLQSMPDVVPIATGEYPAAACRPGYSVLDDRETRMLLGLEAVDWRANLRRVLHDMQRAGGSA